MTRFTDSPYERMMTQAGGRGRILPALFTQKATLLWLWELWSALCGSLPS